MFKRLLAPLLALTMACTSTGAERGYTREARLRPPDLDHPVDVNTDYTLALSEGLGYLNENFARGTDRYFLGRVGRSVATLWIQEAEAYVSHEAAHAYNITSERARGKKLKGGKNAAGLPRVVFNGEPTTLENMFEGTVAGLNQDETNGLEMWKRTDLITLDRALGFLCFKLDDSTYNLRDKYAEAETPFRITPLPWEQRDGERIFVYSPIRKLTTSNDLEQTAVIYEYLGLRPARSSGIEKRAIVADLATASTWESLWTIGKYLATGQSVSEPLVFDVAGHRVSPPLVSSYLTPRGVFYNASVKVDGNIVSVGRNADLPDWRIGVGLGERQVGCFSVSPFAAFNHIGKDNGFSVGSDIGFELGDNASLVLNVQRSKNDILENDVKIVGNGTDVQVGLRIQW